jgi:hypothetical protein
VHLAGVGLSGEDPHREDADETGEDEASGVTAHDDSQGGVLTDQ